MPFNLTSLRQSLASVQAKVHTMTTRLDGFEAKAEAIRNNSELSKSGVAKRLAELMDPIIVDLAAQLKTVKEDAATIQEQEPLWGDPFTCLRMIQLGTTDPATMSAALAEVAAMHESLLPRMLDLAIATRDYPLAYALSLRDPSMVGKVPNPAGEAAKLVFICLDGVVASAEHALQTAQRLKNPENLAKNVTGGLMVALARRIEKAQKASAALSAYVA